MYRAVELKTARGNIAENLKARIHKEQITKVPFQSRQTFDFFWFLKGQNRLSFVPARPQNVPVCRAHYVSFSHMRDNDFSQTYKNCTDMEDLSFPTIIVHIVHFLFFNQHDKSPLFFPPWKISLLDLIERRQA